MFLHKAAKFSVAYVDWLMAGKPRRSPERVKELYQICIQCDDFDLKLKTPFGRGGCKQCGCHISDDSDKDINKLVWPHEGCPLEKWYPEVRKCERK